MSKFYFFTQRLSAFLILFFSFQFANAQIQYDASNSVSSNSSSNSLSWSHTISNNANRVLIVGLHAESSSNIHASSVKFNGVSLTRINKTEATSSGSYESVSLWYLLAPAVTTANIVVTYPSAVTTNIGGSISLYSVEQSAPEANAINHNNSGVTSTSITTQTNGAWLVDIFGSGQDLGNLAAGTGQTKRYSRGAGSTTSAGGSTKLVSTAGSSSMTWSQSGINRSAQVVAAFAPAPPAAPTALSFSNIGGNSMTLNWNDNSSNEEAFYVMMSTDGSNYSLAGYTNANEETFTKTGLSANTLYYWQVYSYADGLSSSALSGTQSTCAYPNISQVPTSSLIAQYKLDGNADDATNNNDGTLQASPLTTTSRFNISANAYSFNGSSQYISTANSYSNPTNFSLSIWFKTTTTSGGRLIGFGSSQTGSSGSYDRQIYMNNAGQIYFGVYPNAVVTINSPQSYNDGEWHQAIATLSSTAGMVLYVDGAQVASNSSTKTAQSYSGYWRIGYDNLGGWNSVPASYYFNGALDDILIYHRTISSSEVNTLYKSPDGAGNNGPVCNGSTLSLSATSVSGASYYWSGPNGFTSTQQNPSFSFSPAYAGTYTVTVTSTGGGCSSTAYTNVDYNGANASIDYTSSPYCKTSGTAYVTRTGTAGGTYSASPSGLSINSSTGAINLSASNAGTYTVTYSIAPMGGCGTYTTTTSVTVIAAPTATIAYAGSPFSSNGGTIPVSQTGTAGGTYSSSAGLSINASTGAINLNASTEGTYIINYTTPANSCGTYTATTTIVIQTDTDGDGIADEDDLDSDNDGITDEIEIAGNPNASTGGTSCIAGNLNWNKFDDGTDPTTVSLKKYPLTITTQKSSNSAILSDYDIENYFTGTSEKELHIAQDVSAKSQKTTTTFNFSSAVKNLSFKIQDVDMAAGVWIDSLKISLSYQGTTYTLTSGQVSTGTYNVYRGNNIVVGINGNGGNTNTTGQVTITYAGKIDKVIIDYWNNDNAVGAQRIGIGGFTYCSPVADTDNDGIPDYQDLDSDNDGIPDVVEAFGADANGNGMIDNFTDADHDGLSDNIDANLSGAAGSGNGLGTIDYDGDGIPNYLDLDSDADGLPDIREALAADNNNNGLVDNFTDANDNGWQDGYENSGALIKTGAANSNGKPASYPNKNIDQVGYPNPYDLDSDGDGIVDIVEAAGPSASYISITNGKVNGTLVNGWATTISGSSTSSLVFTNTDGRGPDDQYDIDSDDDGIPDNVEAQPTYSYKVSSDVNTDMDGIADVYEVSAGTYGANGVTPYDHDADGTPDYRDSDSDNDGSPDINEASKLFTLTQSNINTNDTDGDGLLDQFDNINITTLGTGLKYKNVTNSNMGANGSFDGPVPSGSNVQLVKSQLSGGDRDWRNTSVLPLQIVDFRGVQQAGEITLYWDSYNQQDVDVYDLERSTDGIAFISIAKIKSFNTPRSSYSYNDKDLNGAGKFYYRIKQYNKDGKYFYTNVLVFKIENAGSRVNIYPNPADKYVTLSFTSAASQNSTIMLKDVSGKTLIQKTIAANKGNNVVQLNEIAGLAKGMYIIQVYAGKDVYTERLIKQ